MSRRSDLENGSPKSRNKSEESDDKKPPSPEAKAKKHFDGEGKARITESVERPRKEPKNLKKSGDAKEPQSSPGSGGKALSDSPPSPHEKSPRSMSSSPPPHSSQPPMPPSPPIPPPRSDVEVGPDKLNTLTFIACGLCICVCCVFCCGIFIFFVYKCIENEERGFCE